MTVYDAAQSDDLRALLEAMRDDLARAMDDADPAVKAQLNGQLLKTVQALAALPADTKDKVDELARRRKDRLAKAKTSAPARRASSKRSGSGSS